MKDTLIEIRNNLQGIKGKVDKAKNQINNLEHKEAKKKQKKQKKPNQSEQQEIKRIQKNKDSISSLWDNFKHSNICIRGVPEGEKSEQEIGNLFEKIMKENFPDLEKEIDMYIQEAQSPKQDGCKETHSNTS